MPPTPREVYEHPDNFWLLLTAQSDSDIEGQHFDRKEAGRPGADGITTSSEIRKVRELVKETISAFANANVAGGLLILGIASNGAVKGIAHLSEEQLNSITDIHAVLNNQSAQVKIHECVDEIGAPNRIVLAFTPYTEHAICETPGRSPEAWLRRGPQNIPLTQDLRDRIRRDKRIVDYENAYCCDFDILDVDLDVLTAFRKSFLHDTTQPISDIDLLYQAGAIFKKDDGGYAFNNAGCLFFATNPQRVIAQAYIRLLRFNTTSNNKATRGLYDFEKVFTGPLTKQIRDARTYFAESGFFKTYQKRRPEGGFAEEPEYPHFAIEEAIVNAIAHRDYAVGLPIECEAYRDAFVVSNPGRVIQRSEDVPDTFTLSERILDSMPRNPKLLNWLRVMKDARGKSFVQAISEGTKRMTEEMLAMGLPAPSFFLSDTQSTLKLTSYAEEREARFRAINAPSSTEFTNLYPLRIRQESRSLAAYEFRPRYNELLNTLRDTLVTQGWYIDRFGYSRVLAHRREGAFEIPKAAASILRLYPAYEFQLRDYYDRVYLCVEFNLVVLNVVRLDKLLGLFSVRDFNGFNCVANKDGWRDGRMLEVNREWVKIRFTDDSSEERVPTSAVIPKCSLRMLDAVLRHQRIPFDLHQAIKIHSLSSKPSAARERSDRIDTVVEYLVSNVSPITLGDLEITLERRPVQLAEYGTSTADSLPVFRLAEPAVVFREQRASTDVRDGITKFGSYEDKPHHIELIPVCVQSQRHNMAQLIERLQVGKYKYRGAERTFSTSFNYQTIVTVDSPETIQKEVKRLIRENRGWVGDKALGRLFLVHTPEQGYASDDEKSPYYQVKRLLLENGIPCQMVDTPTLVDPDWKDLNLALNITAKCGLTPWVLPDAIPDADFFVGLSYTQARNSQRIIGFANVFNRYGNWEFYSGNTTSFDFQRRAETFSNLVRDTLTRLPLSLTPNIVFHYSAKFSHEDRDAILQAARSVRREGTFTFVWINSHHNVRVFDSRPETDGSLRRGSYVRTRRNQIYLSTTGSNPFRKVLGTPMPLEVNAWVYQPENQPQVPPDMKSIAVQVLSLTKLNWASTDSFCGEPITTKYAGDIAYLTAAFLRQSEPFRLHEVLERTAWFL